MLGKIASATEHGMKGMKPLHLNVPANIWQLGWNSSAIFLCRQICSWKAPDCELFLSGLLIPIY